MTAQTSHSGKKKKYTHIHTRARAPRGRTKLWALGLCWGYGEGKSRGRVWAWGVFCREDMDESCTQFLSLHWSSPLFFFFAFSSPGEHRVEPIPWSRCWGWWEEVCKAQQRVYTVSLASMAKCPKVTVLLIPEVFLRSSWCRGEELGCIGGSVKEKSYHPSILVPPEIQNQNPLCIRDLIAWVNKVLLLPILQENMWNSHRWILLWITRNLPWPSQFI